MIKKILTKDELNQLSRQISGIEEKTKAELRVVVRHRRHWSERKMTSRQIAEREFRALGMAKTKEGTGILVFILVGERQFELLADHGIINVLPEKYWEDLAGKLSEHFSKQRFFHGLTTSLAEVGEVLEERLPAKGPNTDEFPNEIIEE